VQAGLPARLVAPRAHLSCSRLSDVERGYLVASNDELVRISCAIDELLAARKEVIAVAERVGWPMGAV